MCEIRRSFRKLTAWRTETEVFSFSKSGLVLSHCGVSELHSVKSANGNKLYMKFECAAFLWSWPQGNTYQRQDYDRPFGGVKKNPNGFKMPILKMTKVTICTTQFKFFAAGDMPSCMGRKQRGGGGQEQIHTSNGRAELIPSQTNNDWFVLFEFFLHFLVLFMQEVSSFPQETVLLSMSCVFRPIVTVYCETAAGPSWVWSDCQICFGRFITSHDKSCSDSLNA